MSFGAPSSQQADAGPRRRPPVVPFPLGPPKSVPSHIRKPPYADTGMVPPLRFPEQILLHDETSAARMRDAARLARRTLDMACSLAAKNPGITSDDLDTAVHEAIIAAGAYPSPLNYSGFCKSLCSSINEVICHGIPDSRPLETGDVVSLDVSCYLNHVHGDNCATVIVGDEQDMDEIGVDWRGIPYNNSVAGDKEHFLQARRLVAATYEALYAGIAQCKPGGCLSHIGCAIHDVADARGFSSVQKYRGHGISENFHMAPFVKHFRNSDKLELQPGMIFTIEPMLTAGPTGDCVEWESDGWTVVTVDGSLAAQFEHTVLITDNGVEILTQPE